MKVSTGWEMLKVYLSPQLTRFGEVLPRWGPGQAPAKAKIWFIQ